ncbi:MAG TPA: enoyl-CoA hydratase/isomerase family protein [Syntrophothermus lipocalidus]|nr:enoyl-CoA hydratase/isomerase family protein [Syntrophothermus lipocalidus]
MELKTMLYEKESGIGIITFNRPKVLNAISPDTLDELIYLMSEIESDDEVKCVIITGGSRAFAAGADIAYMAKVDPVECERVMAKFHQAFNSVADLSKPVIAAIAGLAFGGGCELALACDIRIAAEGTKLGFPEVNLGIFPAAGGTQRLTRLVGIGWAKDMIMTGDPIDAETAFKIGLVTRVVKPEDLMDEAKKLAMKLAAKAPITTRVAKQCLNNSISTDLSSGLAFEQKAVAFLFSTEDAKEGLNAFIEKRKANFKGR